MNIKPDIKFLELGLAGHRLLQGILSPTVGGKGSPFVWILSTSIPQPSNKRGIWYDNQLWNDTNVWYD